MKFVVMRNNRSKIKIIKACNGQESIAMGVAMVKESIKSLAEEKNISEKTAIKVIKEIFNEEVFV